MIDTLVEQDVRFRVLAGDSAGPAGRWSGALPQFFRVARRVLASLHADIRLGRIADRAFLLGEAEQHGLSPILSSLMNRIDTEYVIELQSPFEDTPSIAGGLWSGRALFGADHDDALAKLRFSAGTLDLPLHVHEYSDRFIVALEGSGHFWWSQEPLNGFDGAGIRSVPVRPGDVLMFTRNLLHTFSAPDEDLLLLSYHSPEIPFNDPRQYTLPTMRWTPRIHAVH